MREDKLYINSTFKKQLTLAELHLTLEITRQIGFLATSDHKRQQHRVKWCFIPLIYKN